MSETVRKWRKKLMISSNLHSHPCDVIDLSRLLYFFAHLSSVMQLYETCVHIHTSGRQTLLVTHPIFIFLFYPANRTI